MSHKSYMALVRKIEMEYIGKINPKTDRPYTKQERFYIARAKAGEIAHAKKGFGGNIPHHLQKSNQHLPPVLKPWELV